MDFWKRFDAKLREARLKQDWIAEKLGTDSKSISRWKRRNFYPDAWQASLIAEKLNTSVEYLVTGVEPLTMTISDRSLLDRAKFWRETISDLDEIEPPIREPFVRVIHETAERARGMRKAN